MALTPRGQENARMACRLVTDGGPEIRRSGAGNGGAALLRQFLQGPLLPDLVGEHSLQRDIVLRNDLFSGVLDAEALRVLEGLHQDHTGGEVPNLRQVDVIRERYGIFPTDEILPVGLEASQLGL